MVKGFKDVIHGLCFDRKLLKHEGEVNIKSCVCYLDYPQCKRISQFNGHLQYYSFMNYCN